MRKSLPDTLSPPRTRLAAEHRVLESDLFEVAHRLADHRLDDAEFAFSVLDRRLRDHMAVEEETIFPVIDSWLDGDGGFAAPLRGDHDAIRQLLEQVSAALGRRERDAALMTLSQLATCLGEHSDREDEVLYPAAESVSSAFER
jgi:hemerythrin-like domain-containing protein